VVKRRAESRGAVSAAVRAVLIATQAAVVLRVVFDTPQRPAAGAAAVLGQQWAQRLLTLRRTTLDEAQCGTL
jgi:hypothetical protein